MSTKNENLYILNMFPYPSGDGLHLGHALGYVASDIFARYKKSQGYNVLNPMGFDSFGLPAEQYAIQTGQHPEITTKKNTEKYTEQLKNLYLNFDWDRCFCTSDSSYYKHTQRIFIWMFNSFFCLKDKKAHKIEDLYKEFEKNGNDGTFAYGTCKTFSALEWDSFSEKEKYEISLNFRLAYQGDTLVNWCPKLGTVLANDEVKNGFSERGGHPVEQKKMRQWCLRITAYADRLLDALNIDLNKKEVCLVKDDLKPNQPIFHRKSILAIVRHWENKNKFCLVYYPQKQYYAFITGGIEGDESVEEAVRREIREEVGYVNIKKITRLNPDLHERFWHSIKGTNCDIIFSPVFVELEDGERVEISQEEKKIQVEHWIDKREIRNLFEKQVVDHYFDSQLVALDLFEQYEDYFVWPESTKEMQRNWIGRSEGAKIFFKVQEEGDEIEIFTTRPETIYGVTFLAVSQSHPCAQGKKLRENENGIFTGKFAIHPITKQSVPIWVADYVLADYGSGAVMAVPAHDDRDKAFAEKYGIEVKTVIDENGILVNSDVIDGLNVSEARKKIVEVIEEMGIGERTINFRIRDAIFGRQRYWGEPIPVYYKDGLPYVFDEKDLPLELPSVVDFTPTGKPPLANVENWTENGYPIDVHTMPGWAGSSWYFIRYLDAHNEEELASEESLNQWGNVDLYLGGSEHTTGHLIYARFYSHFLYDIGKIPYREPFKKLIHQGMILGESAIVYRVENSNTFVSAGLKEQYNTIPVRVLISLVDDNFCLDVEKCRKWRPDFADAKFVLENGKFQCDKELEKMSKSKHNVVNPDDVINKYGVDTLRLYLMFLGPVEQQKPWSTKGIEGVYRFLKKVENLKDILYEESSEEEKKILNVTIKEVAEDVERYSFNTAISSMMICVNKFNELKKVSYEAYRKLLVILHPFAPKMTAELMESLNLGADWTYPDYDERYLVNEFFEYPIAVNGKVRGKINFRIDEDEEKIKTEVLKSSVVARYVGDKEVKKIFVIKNKMINIVA